MKIQPAIFAMVIVALIGVWTGMEWGYSKGFTDGSDQGFKDGSEDYRQKCNAYVMAIKNAQEEVVKPVKYYNDRPDTISFKLMQYDENITKYKPGFSFYTDDGAKCTLVSFDADRGMPGGIRWKALFERGGVSDMGFTSDSWIDLYTDKVILWNQAMYEPIE